MGYSMGYSFALSDRSEVPVRFSPVRFSPVRWAQLARLGSECVPMLRQAYQQPLESLEQLKRQLQQDQQAQSIAAQVAQAVLYRLMVRLESGCAGCLSGPVDEPGFEALLQTVGPGQLEELFSYGLSFQADLRPHLFNKLDAASLRPGLAGNGYLLAVLMACASRPAGQQALKAMIRPEGEGYSIVFPGREPLPTERPGEIERLLYADAGHDGFWPALLEKAASSLCPQALASIDNGPGALLSAVLELFSGQPAELLDTALTTTDCLRRTLTQALDAGHLVVAACNQYPWLQPVGKGSRIQADAYALIGYEPETNRALLLRAPGQSSPQDAQGHALPIGEGKRLSVPLEAFATYFSHLASTPYPPVV